MKYQRLKSIDGSGTIMRYFKLDTGVAYTNAFYGITDNKASKIEGTVGEGVELIGFSHGGNRLAKGLIFLDINPSVVYMGILDNEEEDRPNIGEVVNGYQKVIDTHYDGDDGVYGKNDDGFGVETMTNPYYLFTIVQPTGTDYASEIDDSDAGAPNVDPETVWQYSAVISVITEGGTGVLKYQEIGGEAQTETLTQAGGETFETLPVDVGSPLSTAYTSIAMYDDTGTNLVVDLASTVITGPTVIPVAVPVE